MGGVHLFMSYEIKIIADQLSQKGKINLLPATTTEKIAEFEKKNEVKFPLAFKCWLQYSDGGELFLPAGIQLYGVDHKPLIDVNDDSRPSDEYIVVGALASGDPILCEKNGEKIAIYNQEAGKIEDDEIYDDFIAFLKDLYVLLGIGE